MRLTWRPKLASAHPGVDCLWILPSVRSQSREGIDGVEPLEVTIAPSGLPVTHACGVLYPFWIWRILYPAYVVRARTI